MSNSRNNEARIYVGNLPPDIRTKDIEDLFYKFGKIAYIDLKNRRGNGSNGGRSRGPPARRTNYRVLVTGLPPTGSWQDLKDHMREAGDVCYADTYKDGTGMVEFLRYEDMKYAIKKLDDSRFRSHEGEVTYVRVKEDSGDGRSGGGRDRERSRSYSPGGKTRGSRGSPSYSPVRRSPRGGGSYSRSRSRSPRSRSRS